MFPAEQFRFRRRQILQPCFPFFFQAPGDESVFRIHSLILPLGPFGLITGALDFQPPLRQGGLAIGFELSVPPVSALPERRW